MAGAAVDGRCCGGGWCSGWWLVGVVAAFWVAAGGSGGVTGAESVAGAEVDGWPGCGRGLGGCWWLWWCDRCWHRWPRPARSVCDPEVLLGSVVAGAAVDALS
jgi:hypothetical protein